MEELSEQYSESVNNVNQELNKNVTKLMDVEKKYKHSKEENLSLKNTVESQSARIADTEERYAQLLGEYKDMEAAFSKC